MMPRSGLPWLKRRLLVAVLALVAAFGLAQRAIAAEGERDAAFFGVMAGSDEDQTSAIQRYLDDVAQRGGGEARLPAGQFTVRGSLSVPTGVTLAGSWQVPHHGILSKGTVLMVYGGRGKETGPAAIELAQSSGARGLTICYPEQTLADVQPYPWSIHVRGMHNTVENVTLVNSYQGIAIGPEWNELHVIRNVYGCVLRRGVFIDNTSDIGRIENVHFNPHYWPRSGHGGVPRDAKPNPDLAVAAYMQEHLEAFVFGRTDWQSVRDTFVFAARIGYRFIATRNGACNGQLSGIGADMCQYGVVVDAAQGPGILISNGQFVCGVLQPKANPRIGIVTGPGFNAALQLTNCSFWGSFTGFVRIEGSGTFSLAQARMESNQSAGIELLGGRSAIREVLFRSGGPHITVGKQIKRAVVTGNFAEGGVKIVNEADGRLIVRENE